jgi:hypothetical protein
MQAKPRIWSLLEVGACRGGEREASSGALIRKNESSTGNYSPYKMFAAPETDAVIVEKAMGGERLLHWESGPLLMFAIELKICHYWWPHAVKEQSVV